MSVCMRQLLTPNKRGFFLNDESISHPYHVSSVPNYMLYTIGFLVPVGVMFLMEGVYIRQSMDNHRIHRFLADSPGKFAQWSWRCYQLLAIFVFGAASTHFLTNLPKYSVGRLRPHFLDVCKPNFSLINDTSKYIEEDVCTGDPDRITEARLSFPSGHSSMSMYCAVFFILYLQKRFSFTRISLLRPLLQVAIFGLGLYTGLSRITDYKHHWDDVLAGAALGCLLAFLTMYRINEIVFKKRILISSSDANGSLLPATHHKATPLPTVISSVTSV
ncbi:phospholipid phosphatase 1 [Plakobranchus ocellatus]|uniref:Phospholipid phosphatase 1 n=1 Tax=Plakobranchus ocellatus TaxID=259542 RepID=A0AAV3ZWD8_9GAST|nr:phospholipid phosphatase 1 [Plakobranchus ocellatus]